MPRAWQLIMTVHLGLSPARVLGELKFCIQSKKELLKFWFPVQVIIYHMVRYLPQLRVVQQSERFAGDGGEAGGCCFDFKVLCIKLSLNGCHHNACEPVCCVSLTGTSPKNHFSLSSHFTHSCCVSFKAVLGSGTFHALLHLTWLANRQNLSNQAQER